MFGKSRNLYSMSSRACLFCLIPLLLHCGGSGTPDDLDRRPNVVLIMTDDQGYGDVGAHQNPQIRTPNMDRLHAESVRLTQFYVSPVCAPTRASLMTGRYCYRTGVVDTYVGRAMMDSSEVTLAELLVDAGYRTGIFGKWHLGDTYPIRAMDQGFQESLVHKGGGIGQPADPPHNSYFDPVLLHNGDWVKTTGYCSDVYTDAAMEFIRRNRDRSFFAYLSTTAPHTPLEIDESYVSRYRDMGLNETTARIYGMVENIDDNLGRLVGLLEELDLDENTILIFMTDNGPQQDRYNAGMRGLKTSVWDGGIRVPFFIRWPGRLQGGRDVDRIAAHIDVLPTLMEACGLYLPPELGIDGMSLVPLFENSAREWPDRSLYFQIHRGDEPILYRNMAARNQKYKIVQPLQFRPGSIPVNPPIYLFDMEADPGESKDIAVDHPDIHRQLIEGYEAWFQDVSATRGYHPVRIRLGTRDENPVILTPQDWRGADHYLAPALGFYEVTVSEAARYQFSLRFIATDKPAVVHLKIGNVERSARIPGKVDVRSAHCSWTPDPIELPRGDARVEGWLEEEGENPLGVRYIHVTRVN